MKRWMSDAGVVLVLVFLACLPARPLLAQSVIYVPDDYLTIQAAISASDSGDTIIVRDGTYTGPGNRNINFQGKALTLRSENGPASTVIDCEDSARGFVFESGESSASSLSGFTITRGRSVRGGGIYILDSSPTISNCIITDNLAIGVNGPPGGIAGHGYGGGIYIEGTGSPVISRCVISDNKASGGEGGSLGAAGDGFGGGIYTGSSATVITHCLVHSNQAWGGDNYHSVSWAGSGFGGGVWGSPTVINAEIYDNAAYGGWAAEEDRNPWKYQGEGYGGAVYGDAVITNSTIADNQASTEYGGITNGQARNSILWGNSPGQVGGATVTFSNIQGGYPGTGNIDEDPQFAPGTDNYRLTDNSPCIDAGDNLFVTWGDDLDGNPRILEGGRAGRRVDMGAYEFPGGGFLLDEGFDGFDIGVRPAGWTFVNCDDNGDTYTGFGEYGRQSPSIRLDSGGDAVVTSSFEMSRSELLVFWVRGMGTAAASRLLVEEYYGADWNNLALINPLPVWGSVMGPFTLNPDSTRLRFSYQKILGDLAFDDVRITAPSPTPFGYKSPSPTPFGYKTPSPTATPIPPTPSPTATPIPPTPSPTPFGYKTPSPTVTPTPPPTPSPTPFGYKAPSPTVTPTPPPTPSPTPFGYKTPSPSPSPPYQTVPFREDFEEPEWELWTTENVTYNWSWHRSSGGHLQNPPEPYSGNYNARYGPGVSVPSPAITRLVSPRLVFPPDAPGPRLIFWHAMRQWQGSDILRILYRTSREGEWQHLTTYSEATYDWTERTVLLPDVGADYYICFEGTATIPYSTYGICIDDVQVLSEPTPSVIPTPSAIPTPSTSPTPVPSPYRLVVDGKDYSGDGWDDIAVWQPASGRWIIDFGSPSPPEAFYFGRAGDLPASGDYDGDGLTDPAVFRPASGLWAVRGVTRLYYGRPGDIPVPADYAGDGSTDPGIFRPVTGLWAVRGVTRAYYGLAGDIPVPVDLSGDGTARIGIFRPATGLWAVRQITRVYFGAPGDYPVPADYPGLIRREIAVFRPSTGLWAVRGLTRFYFGREGDYPQPGDYFGTGPAGAAIYRPADGLWAIRGLTRVYWGGGDYLPVCW